MLVTALEILFDTSTSSPLSESWTIFTSTIQGFSLYRSNAAALENRRYVDFLSWCAEVFNGTVSNSFAASLL